MMKARWVGIAAGVCAPLVLAAVAHAGGARKYTMIKVHTSSGHVCTGSEVDALLNDGTAFGTAGCGRGAVFVRTKTGDVSLYRLPAKDGKFFYAKAIASDGTLVVEGYKHSDYIDYQVSPDGTVAKVKIPAHGRSTLLRGINKHGDAVGVAANSSSAKNFVFRHGTFTYFHKHKYLPDGVHAVNLTAISDDGRIAGYFYRHGDPVAAFVLSNGHRRIIHLPAAVRHSKKHEYTVISEVTTSGAVAGYKMAGSRVRGFVVIHGTLHWIDPHPGAKHPASLVYAVNSNGEVGGGAVVGRHRYFTGFLGQVG